MVSQEQGVECLNRGIRRRDLIITLFNHILRMEVILAIPKIDVKEGEEIVCVREREMGGQSWGRDEIPQTIQ